MTRRSCLFFGGILVLLLIAAGCITLPIGDVSYHAEKLSVTITNPTNPVDVGIQVRVYSIHEFEQHELLTTGTTVTLEKNENTVTMPLHLDPGKYKIYVYLTTNGVRETAVIRDIVVE